MIDCPQCGIVAAGHQCPPTYVQQLQAENERLRRQLEDQEEKITQFIIDAEHDQETIRRLRSESIYED